jgi:hypothetical protein
MNGKGLGPEGTVASGAAAAASLLSSAPSAVATSSSAPLRQALGLAYAACRSWLLHTSGLPSTCV